MQHLVTLYTTPRSIDTWEPAEWWTLGERSTLDTETSPEGTKKKSLNLWTTITLRQTGTIKIRAVGSSNYKVRRGLPPPRQRTHDGQYMWRSTAGYTASLWTTCKTTRSSEKKNARVEQGSPSPSPPCTSAFSGWLPSPTPSVVARKPGPQLKGSVSESGTENLFLLENIGEDEQVLTLLARLENLRDKMLSLMFDITGEQFTNISVFAVPPKESRMNCVSLLFR